MQRAVHPPARHGVTRRRLFHDHVGIGAAGAEGADAGDARRVARRPGQRRGRNDYRDIVPVEMRDSAP